MTGHQLSIAIALALICGPLLFALAGAYRENFARQIDQPREKTRDALAPRDRSRLGTVR